MKTRCLFRDDAYRRNCEAEVLDAGPEGVVLDQTVFYPLGGGQPGDAGWLKRENGERIRIIDTRKDHAGIIRHIPGESETLPSAGETVNAELDWDRRHLHMRMHTCLHLLGAVLPYGVTGGSISATKSRLDFDMQELVDKDEVSKKLNDLVAADHTVRTRWITDEELAAQPELIRTMSVKPPRGAGRVRLLEIPGIDLQPCGGTHVAHTGEIGTVRISKVEKKGRHNRRVHVVFA